MKINLSSKNIVAYILTWLFIGVLLIISSAYIFSNRPVAVAANASQTVEVFQHKN